MGVAIKYKGSTIASMNADGTKTLKTAGKYCEGDIGVEYSAPTPTLISKSINSNGTYSAALDGADGYSGVVVNVPSGVTSCITSMFTVTSAKGNQDVTLISGNSFIAANYNNPKAFALVLKTSDLQMNGINMAVCTNQQFGVLSSGSTTGVYGWFNGNTGDVSLAANRITHSLSTQSTTIGNMYATASGNLILRVGGAANALQVGNYFIIFGLMEQSTPAYTNQIVESRSEISGSTIYNAVGYKEGYRYNSSQGEAAQSGMFTTGVIHVPAGATVRFYGDVISGQSGAANSLIYQADGSYDFSFTPLVFYNHHTTEPNSRFGSYVYDDVSHSLRSFVWNRDYDVWMKFTCIGAFVDGTTVITVNEEM